MNNKFNILIMILFSLPVLIFSEVTTHPQVYLKFNDFNIYLGQDVSEVKEYFGEGSIKEIEKPSGIYIQESFQDGTRISYYKDEFRVIYFKTINPSAESPLKIRVNDTKTLLLNQTPDLYIQGNLITYSIPLIPIDSADPLGASIIFVIKNDLVSEIHGNYQTD